MLILGTWISNPSFLDDQGIKDLLLNASILVLLAVGQSVVVITRNIDLSVGSVVGLTAFACGNFVSGTDHSALVRRAARHRDSASSAAWSAACWSASAGCPRWWSPSACSTSSRASTTPGRTASRSTPPTSPTTLLGLGSGSVLGVPYLPLITAAVLVGTAYYLRSYRSGRELYAIGSSPEAARLAGIPIRRRVLAAYAFSGAVAGLAGALWLARFGTVVADAANGWELTVVSAVVVGGVAITGGVGTRLGRGARRAAAHHDRQRPRRPEGRLRSGSRPSPARCCSRPSASTGS